MNRKSTSPALIGAFVLGAIVLAIAGVLVFGSGGLLEEKMHFSLVFDHSVKGLRAGAPVNFRGVPIGTVTNIRVQVDPASLDFRVLVEIEIDGDAIVPTNGQWSMMERLQRYKVVDALIARGLRAQLQLQSLVTGQLMVDLDFHPEVPARLVGGDLPYKELPTMPSGLEELTKAVSDLPFKQLVDTAIHTLRGVDKLINAPELQHSLVTLDHSLQDFQQLMTSLNTQVVPLTANMDQAVGELRGLVKNIDGQVQPVGDSLQRLTANADRTLKHADAALAGLSGVAGEDSTLQYDLRQALQEVTAAARAVRTLTETLERQPDALLRGKSVLEEER